MKKLVFILSLIGTSIFAYSQGILIKDTLGNSIAGDTLVIEFVVDKNDAYQEIHHSHFLNVINSSASTMTIGLVRREVQIISGTSDYLCWGSQCFGARMAGSTPIWDVADSAIVASNDTAGGAFGGLAIYFLPNLKNGESIYRYEFYDRNSLFTRSSVYIKYIGKFPTGIKENELNASNVTLFPNPASNYVSISLDEKFSTVNKTIEVHDLVGKLVRKSTFPNGTNQAKLDVTNFDSGIYFVRILAGQQSVVTKKLIVK